MSAHDTPLPTYPGMQAQAKLPWVFVQVALELQPPLFTEQSQSLTSMHVLQAPS
nr:hypothetical protein [Myxococcus landrumus]